MHVRYNCGTEPSSAKTYQTSNNDAILYGSSGFLCLYATIKASRGVLANHARFDFAADIQRENPRFCLVRAASLTAAP